MTDQVVRARVRSLDGSGRPLAVEVSAAGEGVVRVRLGEETAECYKNIPIYLSSRGYGLLVDSGTATEFDLCHGTHSRVQIRLPDDVLDYYVLAGPTPAQVLARYARLTGLPTLPPKWA